MQKWTSVLKNNRCLDVLQDKVDDEIPHIKKVDAMVLTRRFGNDWRSDLWVFVYQKSTVAAEWIIIPLRYYEELERGDTAFRTAVSVHIGLNSMTLMQWGNEAQKEKYLVPQAKGEQVGAFGLTEPGAGSDVAAMSTTAVRDGDDYILNGQKTWISLCDSADNFLVFAYTDKEKKHHGISAFIVERTTPGFSSKAIKGKYGIRAGNTGELFFEDMRIPAANLIGEEGEAPRSRCPRLIMTLSPLPQVLAIGAVLKKV